MITKGSKKQINKLSDELSYFIKRRKLCKINFSLCNSLQCKYLPSLKIMFDRSESDATRVGQYFSGSISKCLQAILTNKEDVYSCHFIYNTWIYRCSSKSNRTFRIKHFNQITNYIIFGKTFLKGAFSSQKMSDIWYHIFYALPA